MYNTTHQAYRYTKGVNTCEYIVLHHTGEGLSVPGINVVKYLTSKNDKMVSVHYLVDQDGTIYKMGDEHKILHHAGESTREGKKYMNQYAIGIEIKSDGYIFSKEQKEAVRILVKDLMQRFSIPCSRIIRHKDISSNRKRDVGDKFRIDEYCCFSEYQKSFAKREGREYLDKLLLANSAEHIASSDPDYKMLLHELNNKIREYYGILNP